MLFIDAKTERKFGRHLRNKPKPDPVCSQHEARGLGPGRQLISQHQRLQRGTLNSVRGKENPKIDEVPAQPSPAQPSPEWCRNTEIESEDGVVAGCGGGLGWGRGGEAELPRLCSRALQLTFSRPLQLYSSSIFTSILCTSLACLADMWHVVLRMICANFL